jgi:hypothetical protein
MVFSEFVGSHSARYGVGVVSRGLKFKLSEARGAEQRLPRINSTTPWAVHPSGSRARPLPARRGAGRGWRETRGEAI